MGSATSNFYNDAYSRGGFADEAKHIQQLWLDGKRDLAAAEVPDELVLQTNFLGTVDQVTERVKAYKEAGVNVLRVAPEGDTQQDRLDALGQIVDIVRALDHQ